MIELPSPFSPVMTAVTPAILEPTEQTAQLGAEDSVVREPGEERLDCIQHQALGSDGINRVSEPNEEPFEIVFPRHFDLATFDMDIVEHDLLFGLKRCEVEAHRVHVRAELGCVFLEHHKNAGLD